MYRKPSPRRQAEIARRLEAMRAGKERAALARGPSPRAPELPLLRREVTITDHDTGQPITHTLRLLRSNRVDIYRVEVDGQPWRRAGWSATLAMLRKAYPRVPVRVRPRAPAVERADHSRIGSRNHSRNRSAHEQ